MNHRTQWTIRNILQATSGELVCGEEKNRFDAVSIDSRSITPDELFVAICGHTHDGHNFLADVVHQGVRGVIVAKNHLGDLPLDEWHKRNMNCIAVDDTTQALGGMAAFLRRQLGTPVIAITGTNGKTTTRGFTEAVLKNRFNLLATTGNLNNEIGVPLTLFQLKPEHAWAVLELGMNHIGEIDRLAHMCEPRIGVITNIGPGHLEGVGSEEGVMHAKGELLDNLSMDGTAVLNADDPWAAKLALKAPCDVLYYGITEGAAVRADDIHYTSAGTCFKLRLPDETVPIKLSIPGTFMVSNALAAAAVGVIAKLTAREIKAGLEAFLPVKGRLNIVSTAKGFTIIDDTYNANPASMAAALQVLNLSGGEGKRIFVAGDMFELGDQAGALHRKLGILCAASNIDRLYAVGEFAQTVADGALSQKMDNKHILIGTKPQILTDLKETLSPGDWVLVKGSRGMAMEEISRALIDYGQADSILHDGAKESNIT